MGRLGLVVIIWAQVEAQIGEILSLFLGADLGSMYLVTQSVSNSTQIGWLRTLTNDSVKQLEIREGIHTLLNEADELRAERNCLVHGLWTGGSQPETAEVQTVRLDRTEMVQTMLVTVSDLDDLSVRARDLLQGLGDLRSAMESIKKG